MRKVLFILSELADADINWMMENGVKRTLTEGTLLIQEGRPIDALYILLDGHLSVTVSALGGKAPSILRSGEILGELSFLDSRPPSATVAAVDAATVLAIPRGALAAKLREDDGFAARFYRALGVFLASRLRRREERLGYESGRVLDEDVEHEDEIDPGLLDTVGLAGARFDWMLKRLQGAPSVPEPAGTEGAALPEEET